MNAPADPSVKKLISGIQNSGVNLNTVMIIGLAVGGFLYVRNIETAQTSTSPVAQGVTRQEAEALSDMFEFGIPVLKSGIHKDCTELGESIDRYLFIYFDDLSDPAKQWVDGARERIGGVLGTQDLKQAKIITESDREALVVLFGELSSEADTLSK